MINIVLLGDRDVRFHTHRELDASLGFFPPEVSVAWLPTDSKDAGEIARSADGVWVVPGTPYKSDDTVYEAISYARATDQPFLGTCGGFQYAVVEFARNVAKIDNAAHAESAPEAKAQIVERLSCSLVGEERIVEPVPGTAFSEICGTSSFTGYHYCNFGMSDKYIEELCSHGLEIGARAKDAGVESIELPSHRFYIATLFQPQVGTAERGSLHPVIERFITACSG